MRRKLPRDYVGRNHETLGSDIIALVRALERIGTAESAARTFGPTWSARLAAVKPDAWYPIADLLDALDRLHERVGANGVRRAGREVFRLSHESRMAPASARDIVYGIDGMYRHANRGHEIGGWKVLAFDAGHAELLKNTPHLCLLEEGILSEGLMVTGARSVVTQPTCILHGGDHCHFVLTSTITDQRWDPGASPLRP